MRRLRGSVVVAGAMLGVSGLIGCGDDEPKISLEWVSQPPSAVERGRPISATFAVVTDDPELTITGVGLLACAGAVPDCGLGGEDAIGFRADATVGEDGNYTADLEIAEQGNWTVVAHAFVDGDYISSPLDVNVQEPAYPAGPYGYALHDIVEDIGLQGFKDADDADDDPFDEIPREIELHEFYQGEDPDAKLILINVGAGWCPCCSEQMEYMAPGYSQYYQRGIRILSVVVEDDDNNAADLDFAKTWGARFSSKMPTVIDPENVLEPYYPERSIPLNIYVEASKMMIVSVSVGWAADDMNHYFDFYAP